MNRTMTIAAATALCVHAVFLLGFNSAPVASTAESTTVVPLEPDPPEDVEMVPPPKVKQAVAQKHAQPRPTLAEHPVPISTAPFVIVTPPLPATRLTLTHLKSIPLQTLSTDDLTAGGPDTSIFNADQLDGVPQTRVRISPVYPPEMKQQGISGQVTVEFNVDRRGRVMTAHVVDSTNPGFNEAAVRAVKHWRFVPGRHNGRPVPFRMRVVIGFRLDD